MLRSLARSWRLLHPASASPRSSVFGSLLPGAIFLAGFDATTGTGRLSYENAELRFNATVDAGVSNYIITSDYLLYTIPYGPDRGIWLATGK